ncbi:helix-turn-helix domain-containing protein [Nocardioides panacis]|uniref:Helix-turn-helix domain-containing protein n=1 Tax=Nocardioides panacis TaxID=2849501 RepID=A0A975SYK2_9ACTN|nr:GAF domain-containing protein [Nocardioides panacis]QWZ08221.1 helix-turn-helix domain-containing protein [Nocardioides panacis]
MSEQFLDLLYGEAPREAFDAVVTGAVDDGLDGPALQRLRDHRTVALRIREQMERQRQREAEMSALYETANDLTAIRDVDAILAAIVRRARSLLHADMTYLSLNDETDGASYMKVTEGALTPEFRRLRLPLGTGLLGLVAQTGEPYFTEDYQNDERFLHREFIDSAVDGENIRAILGVPLTVEGTVIGALLAVHRQVRRFPPREVSLLMSFAAHAAVALENARLFEKLDTANQQVRAQAHAVEVAASAHDKLTDVLLHGGGVGDVADVVADVLHGSVVVLDTEGHRLAGESGSVDDLDDAIGEARASGRSVRVSRPGGPSYVAVALAGSEHLGTLLLHGLPGELGLADRRTLERGALVTALVLLFSRSVAEAEERVRGELLNDLLERRDLDEARLVERARRQHAELEGPTVVAVAAVEGLDRHRAAQVAARLGGELQGLAGEHDGRVVLVAPAPEDARAVGRQLCERVQGAGGSCTVGVAIATGGPAEVAAAYGEARRCLDTLVTLGRTGEVSDPAGLGLARLLLGQNGPEELDAFIETLVGPVLAYDARRGTELVGTLEAWFAAGSRPAETAKRLHVHPNTVAQRLDRVSTLLGEDWRDPARGLDVQLALRLFRLRAR